MSLICRQKNEDLLQNKNLALHIFMFDNTRLVEYKHPQGHSGTEFIIFINGFTDLTRNYCYATGFLYESNVQYIPIYVIMCQQLYAKNV